MNIPLDNLYNFIEGIANNTAVFYLFLPHGSRKISDLKILKNYPQQQILTAPRVICHDQEPLNFAYYTDDAKEMQICKQIVNKQFIDRFSIENWLGIQNNNLRLGTYQYAGIPIHDKTVLLHSELNSLDLDTYQKNGYVGAYWWSHAIISRDWYRYAQVDPKLYTPRFPTTSFLIYSRGFTKEREYRLKFLELLVKSSLHQGSKVSILHKEDEQLVAQYTASDRKLQVADLSFLSQIPECQAPSSSSAGYDASDIVSTYINVVLETQFNGSKLHLTEKTLRPIACGQPFILAAAPGALTLLRHYGFHTYESLIDESYDFEIDPVRRLEKIIFAMKKLQSQSVKEWQDWWHHAQQIALHNQRYFFSNDFYQIVVNQLRSNLTVALQEVGHTKGKLWRSNRNYLRNTKCANWKTALTLDNEKIKLKELLRLRKIGS
jgi:hypothetical protein